MKSTSYRDSCQYLQVELKDSGQIARGKPWFRTPITYRTDEVHEKDQYVFNKDKNTYIYYLSSTDSIYLIDAKTGKIIQGDTLPFFNGYRKFDYSKPGNMAHSRVYSATVEYNAYGGLTSNKDIWILKRNQKEDFFDTTRMSMIMLDSNLKTKRLYNFRPGIRGFIPFSKGLLRYSHKDKLIEIYEMDNIIRTATTVRL